MTIYVSLHGRVFQFMQTTNQIKDLANTNLMEKLFRIVPGAIAHPVILVQNDIYFLLDYFCASKNPASICSRAWPFVSGTLTAV